MSGEIQIMIIFHNLFDQKHIRGDQSMTALLSGIVVVLIICHLPKTVVNMYECYQVTFSFSELLSKYFFR